jgi:Zn-dependent protease with chaperone function
MISSPTSSHIISTHPYTKNRIENIEEIIEEQSLVERQKLN